MTKPKLRTIEPKKKTGLVIVLTGDGKGKTTSAMGMALRAAGHGMKVCVICFIKGDMFSGEFESLRRLAPQVELHIMGRGFYKASGKAHDLHREAAQEAFSLAREKMLSGKRDMLVLDEINNAVKLGLVDLKQVTDLLDEKPELMHLVLTGRDAHPDVIARAHTVTQFKEIKHAYSMGIEPQKGVDY